MVATATATAHKNMGCCWGLWCLWGRRRLRTFLRFRRRLCRFALVRRDRGARLRRRGCGKRVVGARCLLCRCWISSLLRIVRGSEGSLCWPGVCLSVFCSSMGHQSCGGGITCNIASLCISWPRHAGIMSLSTPNSSFIFDRRRLSIRLCAVLRAILRP